MNDEVKFTSEEMTISLSDFASKYLNPAIKQLAKSSKIRKLAREYTKKVQNAKTD